MARWGGVLAGVERGRCRTEVCMWICMCGGMDYIGKRYAGMYELMQVKHVRGMQVGMQDDGMGGWRGVSKHTCTRTPAMYRLRSCWRAPPLLATSLHLAVVTYVDCPCGRCYYPAWGSHTS
jgi:hypothetical protein